MARKIFMTNLKDRVSILLSKYKSILIFIVIFIVLSLVSDVFFTGRNLMNVVRQICAAATLGVGFTLVVANGNIDLSVGSLVGMVGIITAMLSKVEGISPVIVIIVGLLIGAFSGLINAIIINTFKLPSFIVTLASMSIFKGVTYIVSNTTPITNIPKWYVAIGQGSVGPIPIVLIILLFVAVIGTLLLTKTVFGRNVLAMGGNIEATRVCGVNINRVRLGVFAFMGACAAVAGFILTGRAASAQVSAGQGMELNAIAAVVIGGSPLTGGKGSIVGTIFGTLIVGSISNGLNLLNVGSNWQLVAKGLLILGAIILDAQSLKLSSKMLKKDA